MQFLFIDRITHLIPREIVRGIKHITVDDYYLCLDESGQVCFIPSLIGEALGQLAAWNVMSSIDFSKRPVAGIVSSARIHRPAYLGETLYFEAQIDHLDEDAVRYHGQVYAENDLIFTLDGALGPLLPMGDFIDVGVVRQQFNQIYRPMESHVQSLPTPRVLYAGSSDADKKLDPAYKTQDVGTNTITRLTFDHIIEHELGVYLRAEKRIMRGAPYFPDHFPKKPVLPMTILLECQLNLARQFVMQANFEQQYRIDQLRKVKMNEFVYPGDVVSCELHVKRQDETELVLSLLSQVEGKRVCVLEIAMQANGKVIP